MNPIKLGRTLDGLKAVDVAKKTGIDRAVLSLFECGWREPTPAQLAKIKKAIPSYERALEILNGGGKDGRREGSGKV